MHKINLASTLILIISKSRLYSDYNGIIIIMSSSSSSNRSTCTWLLGHLYLFSSGLSNNHW